jgi:phage gp36-like protein
MPFITQPDLKQVILEDELLQIARNDTTTIAEAISAAEAEMRGYLFDSYDVDAIFSATGTDRHPLLVRYCADIAVYYIVSTAQAGQYADDRKSRYDRACSWLKMVKKMEHYEDLPRREETEQDHFVSGSNTKRNNHY